jgi:hypothetical protein
MFSRYRESRDIRVVCLALEGHDGNLSWWRPRFHRYVDGLAGKLPESGVEQAIRLLKLEHGDMAWCKAVHVRERTWVRGVPVDRTISVSSLPELH